VVELCGQRQQQAIERDAAALRERREAWLARVVLPG
jgi:hypothetical protein